MQIHKLARSGQIRVDGGRVKPDMRLAAGAQVRVPPLPDLPASEDGGLSKRDAAFARSLVLYEDDEVLALNKPSGLAVQGGTKTTRHVDRLVSAWGEGLERPRLVHRLDRDTSGVLVLGKGPAPAARLAQAFAQRWVEKTCWAIVAGRRGRKTAASAGPGRGGRTGADAASGCRRSARRAHRKPTTSPWLTQAIAPPGSLRPHAANASAAGARGGQSGIPFWVKEMATSARRRCRPASSSSCTRVASP